MTRSFSPGRLVQAVARDRVPKEETRVWVEVAVAVVDQAWPMEMDIDYRTWPECERLMPHSAACMDHADTFEVTTAGVALLANHMGYYLEGRAAYTEAEPLFRRALDGNEQVLGPDHPYTLRSVNNLAGLLYSKGDLDGAEPLFRRALEGLEKRLGSAHPTTNTVRGNLMSLLEELGRVG